MASPFHANPTTTVTHIMIKYCMLFEWTARHLSDSSSSSSSSSSSTATATANQRIKEREMGKGNRSKVGHREAKGSNNAATKSRKCGRDTLPPNHHHVDKDDLYKELWQACAGPLVYVPQAGERVVYFPQGHMEQVEAFMNLDTKTEMPPYNLPSKIFCRVLNVQLKAEAGTDEVFAQITLLPEAKQEIVSLLDGNSLTLSRKTCTRSFSKKLTSSDTSTHGGFSVLKRHAEECLPSMDMSGEPPEQKLYAKDVHGYDWCFRHVFRGQPKRHLLTTGWSTFVTSKKLLPGDAFIFLRGENEELRIGVRRAMKQQNNASTSVISACSMQHGILATAVHAINTGTMFMVYFHPWTSPTEFIIPLDQYLESAEIDYSVGTRFRMLFEGEECSEQRIDSFEGSIISSEDVDQFRWPNSEWRSLKVKWDDTSEGLTRPDRVSPWTVEPIEPIKKHTSPLHPSKKARSIDASLSGFPSMIKAGILHGPVENATPNLLGVLQGQEKRDTCVNRFGAHETSILSQLIPQNTEPNNKTLGLENQLCSAMHGAFHPCPSGTILFSGGNLTISDLRNGCRPPLSSYGIPENAIVGTKFSILNVNSCDSGSQGSRTLKLKDANEIPHAPPKGGGRYKLFGVDLDKNPPELPSSQVSTYSDHESLFSPSPMSQSSVSEPSKSTSAATNSDSQCKNCSATDLSCTKVLKYGAAGRLIDLTRFNGYGELIRELDQIFDFNGSLIDERTGWQVTYDDEGDLMLVGDCPWKKFQRTVRRMVICQKKDIGRLNPSSPNGVYV
ncbi:auxin response factor 2B-like isoform X2 [Mercurialis annua]|uniref:auxin response factor 2B-like isoform X2 n=1 Tax=Mercurialis annua TaxID=3986 RepID=UPI00215FD0B0|nr:auxin response factor 2B-like isoform X2 [Mercurialis annua]